MYFFNGDFMANNKNLARAKKEKNDEFYTQILSIENEVRHHKKHFKDKVVLCNCNDDETKNFTGYFWLNFMFFGLKRLLCVSFSFKNKGAYYIDINRQNFFLPMYDLVNQDFNWCDAEKFKKPLKGNGDFRSQECIDLLKQADIVVTNPPFSLFREYIAQLIEYDKKFLIIGNINAVTYKNVFPLFKENKIWLGYNPVKSFKDSEGQIKKFGNVLWFTNLDIEKRHEDLILFRKYNPEDYPKYDNYDAINVNKTVDIPIDYDGVMGVPITFLDKYNPEQFDVVGGLINGLSYKYDFGHPIVNGRELYKRILIKKKII